MERAQILEAVSKLTVLELSQLIKDMEEKFGVSAAAAVAVAGPAAAGDTVKIDGLSVWIRKQSRKKPAEALITRL